MIVYTIEIIWTYNFAFSKIKFCKYYLAVHITTLSNVCRCLLSVRISHIPNIYCAPTAAYVKLRHRDSLTLQTWLCGQPRTACSVFSHVAWNWPILPTGVQTIAEELRSFHEWNDFHFTGDSTRESRQIEKGSRCWTWITAQLNTSSFIKLHWKPTQRVTLLTIYLYPGIHCFTWIIQS